jgi:hypothetical protein
MMMCGYYSSYYYYGVWGYVGRGKTFIHYGSRFGIAHPLLVAELSGLSLDLVDKSS